MKLFEGMIIKQKKEIKEYDFNYIGYEFEITEVLNSVVKFKSFLGIGGIEKNKIEEYFEIVNRIEYENIDKIIRNDNVTVVFLKDGNKGVSRCMDCDVYDFRKGFEIAKLKAEIKSKSKRLKKLAK